MNREPLGSLMARALAASPRARELCRRLQGRALLIVAATDPAAAPLGAVRIASDGERLQWTRAAADTPSDAALRGSPLALAGLPFGDAQALLQRGVVRLEGDAETARLFAELLQLLKPDAEELLGTAIGRLPAHGLARAAHQLLDFGRNAARSSAQSLADYFAHEQRTLVPRTETEHRQRRLEALREQLDRLEARVELGRQRLQRLAP